MKKIININFQGRVIPIEESAYDILKYYIESLRKYFAGEEGRDEIINDIESRIAELFSDRLKRTSTCITDEDVNSVIAGIGRPEDLQEAEGSHTIPGTAATPSEADQAQYQHASQKSRRLYRSQNDKILGGVSAGLANFFGIDPSIMRLLFVLMLFMGFVGFFVYIVLWIVVPAKMLTSNVRKRLYRNPDNRMIGGVSGGIGAYLNIDAWIPRIIFLLPFIMAVFVNIFRNAWIMDFDRGPDFIFSGFGGTLFIIYIVLWIVLPEAVTATEKLEMRGEKVDLESIKKTVREDLESIKAKTDKFGGEVKERAQHFGQEIKQAGQSFTSQAAPIVRSSRSGLGHAIGVLFKAFFLFIAGIIVFALLMALAALLFSGVGAFPFKDFVLQGFWQNLLAWSTFLLFIGIPIVALLTWLIRRVIGVKSRNHYLGYTFGSLWIVGLVSAVILAGLVGGNFRSKTSVREEVPLTQPANGKLLVKVMDAKVRNYGGDWFGFDGDLPFFSQNEDSLTMNTVQVKLVKSDDSLYHIHAVKFSNGNSPAVAERLANRINFNVSQTDSFLYLPKGFIITQSEKFRNQQVMVIVEVPVGKRVEVDRNVDQYEWFSINMNRRRAWNSDWDERWNNSYYYNTDKEYVMTPGGLEETGKRPEAGRNGRFKLKIDEDGIEAEGDINPDESPEYRYDRNKRINRDTVIIFRKDSLSAPPIKKETSFQVKPGIEDTFSDSPTALYTLLKLFI